MEFLYAYLQTHIYILGFPQIYASENMKGPWNLSEAYKILRNI